MSSTSSCSSSDDEIPPTWEYGIPALQPVFFFDPFTVTWKVLDVAAHPPNHQVSNIASFRLITWNIDAMISFGRERMETALSHLHSIIYPADSSTNTPNTTPIIILLQEMTPTDLAVIKKTSWIQTNFYITDKSSAYWESNSYGTTILAQKSDKWNVEQAFRVHYPNTYMGRDGLFVDLAIWSSTGGETDEEKGKNVRLRVCNTHLESLKSNPPKRPDQLVLASKYMHGTYPEGVKDLPTPSAAVLAGDLNAFAPEDLTAVSTAGLSDVYLVLGGKDGSEEGYTWGMQSSASEKRFGFSRMDKVLYCGVDEDHVRLVPKKIERIGEGLTAEVSVGENRKKEVWVTDHLGLLVEFDIEGNSTPTLK